MYKELPWHEYEQFPLRFYLIKSKLKMKSFILLIWYYLIINLTAALEQSSFDSDLTLQEYLHQNSLDLKVNVQHFNDSIAQYSIWNGVLSINHRNGHFFKDFGQSIKKLTIFYNTIPATEQNEINRLVNTYCFDNLTEFSAIDADELLFDDMKNPFKKVERATFVGVSKLSKNSLQIVDLFPELRHLNLDVETESIFDHHYPHLMEINTCTSSSISYKRNIPTKTLIEKNPHIQILRLAANSMEYLKFVNDNLPKLETLQFTMPKDVLGYKVPEIHFETITKLHIIDTRKYFTAGKLFFKELTELCLWPTSGEIADDWINFIAECQGLKRLDVPLGYFNDLALSKLSTTCSSLIEAKFRCSVHGDPEIIANFIKSNPQMKSVILRPFPFGNELFFTELVKRLGSTWQVMPLQINCTKPIFYADFHGAKLTKSNQTESVAVVEAEMSPENTTEIIVNSSVNTGNAASNYYSNIAAVTGVILFYLVHTFSTDVFKLFS